MNILQINKLYYPWIGGVEKVVQDISEGLRNRINIEVLVCQPIGKGKTETINEIKVTRTSSLGIYKGMPVSVTFPFTLAKKMKSFDIIHFHLPFPLGVFSYLFGNIKNKKIVVTYHSDIVRQKKLLKYYEPFLYKFLKEADVILPTSPNLLKYSKYLESFTHKCKIVPLSIDYKNFSNSNSKQTQIRTQKNRKTILFVGRLSYYKGLEYLIESMREVKAHLILIGEGNLKIKLEKEAMNLGVSDKISFLGKVADQELKNYYNMCDLFVLPSVKPSEAFGIVQLEAMAYGLPIVNTNLPTGVPFVSKNGETGITVPPKDSKALATAINKILNDNVLAERFSRNAKKRVKEKFSKSKMLDNILSVYYDLIN